MRPTHINNKAKSAAIFNDFTQSKLNYTTSERKRLKSSYFTSDEKRCPKTPNDSERDPSLLVTFVLRLTKEL